MIMQVAIFKADYVGLPNYRNGDCWFCFRFHFHISHRQEEHPSDEMCFHFTLCMWQSLNCSSGIRRDADSSLSSPAPSSCPCLTQGTRGIDFVPLGLTSHLDAHQYPALFSGCSQLPRFRCWNFHNSTFWLNGYNAK